MQAQARVAIGLSWISSLGYAFSSVAGLPKYAIGFSLALLACAIWYSSLMGAEEQS